MNRRPRKRFGQHFLRDRAIIEKILNSFDPQPGQIIVEIGPGRGALTLPLLDRARAMHAVEIDRDLADRLPALAANHGELILHRADALTFDFRTLVRGTRLRLLGNLPYNISTPLLFRLIAQADAIEDMTFMLQKEVADRLMARPGTKAYGRLTVMIQWRCHVEHILDVGPDAFTPSPKVHSSVVRLRPWRDAPIDVGDAQRFAEVVKAAFGQRRKTLRNGLRSLLDATAIAATGIDPTRRAEELTLEEFACLSRTAVTKECG
jgi:16S rRNA (adenine1518-N6/adenine1519-N6)-dimethyltransferase